MPNKIRFEQVQQEFEERGYHLLSTEYVNSKQKLQYICPKHEDKGVQEISYHHFHYRGHGCRYCGREKACDSHRLSESYVRDMATSLGWEYVGVKTDGRRTEALVICPAHRERGTQIVQISSLQSGQGCKYCARNVRLTNEEYVDRVHNVLPHIEIRSEYISQTHKVIAYCTKHNVEWEARPYDLLRSSACGCKECARDASSASRFKSLETRNEQLKRTNPNLRIESEILEKGKPVKFRCMVCQHVWETSRPHIYYSGRSICPRCAKRSAYLKMRKTDQEFRDEMKNHLPHIIPIDEYVNGTTPIRFYCTKHNVYYTKTPNQVLCNKNGCPKCVPKYAENSVADVLDEFGVEYIREYTFEECRDKYKLPFDFYLPEYNVAVEYDGEDHYMPINRNGRGEKVSVDKLKYTQHHDKIKNDYCVANGVGLIRIPYWEKNNLEEFIRQQLSTVCNINFAT